MGNTLQYKKIETLLNEKENGMTKHIILWNLKDELDETRKAEIKADIKKGLEGLQGKIPGLLSIHAMRRK